MSSQNRVDPFEIRPESGLGGRWPMRCRPGSSVEGVPGFGHQASGCTRFWPLLKKQMYVITAIYHNRAVESAGGPALMLGTMLQIG